MTQGLFIIPIIFVCRDPPGPGTDGPGRAYQYAEMAAYAPAGFQHRFPVLCKSYGLMASVGAGDSASSAAYAFLSVKLRKDPCVSFQYVGSIAYGIFSDACDLFDAVMRKEKFLLWSSVLLAKILKIMRRKTSSLSSSESRIFRQTHSNLS